MTASQFKQEYAEGRQDFSGADLYGVNLSGANLTGAKIAFMQDGVIGETITLSDTVTTHSFNKESGRLCFMLKEPNRKIVICGCYINTLEAFEARCKEVYPNDHKAAYAPQIAYLKSL